MSETGPSARQTTTASQAAAVDRGDASQSPIRALPQPAEPLAGARALAGEYPFAVMLGGLALGALVGAFLPRSAGRKLAKGAIAAASVAGELGLLYGRQALEKAGDAAGSLDELKDSVSSSATDYSRKAADAVGGASRKAADIVGDAGRLAADAAVDALASARDASHKIGKQVIKLRSHMRH